MLRETLADETAGYLAADHTIRRLSHSARRAAAATILTRYPAVTSFDRGYRSRLQEFTTAGATR